jgi:hypothetical protein
VEVADHDPGLTPEAAARVFERFYRVDPSRSRDLGGSGLGPAIAATITDGHDGCLEVDTGRRAVPARPPLWPVWLAASRDRIVALAAEPDVIGLRRHRSAPPTAV